MDGQDQILHYLRTTDTHVSFLIVFDARMNDYGVGFKAFQAIDNLVVHTIAVDMRPKINKVVKGKNI